MWPQYKVSLLAPSSTSLLHRSEAISTVRSYNLAQWLARTRVTPCVQIKQSVVPSRDRAAQAPHAVPIGFLVAQVATAARTGTTVRPWTAWKVVVPLAKLAPLPRDNVPMRVTSHALTRTSVAPPGRNAQPSTANPHAAMSPPSLPDLLDAVHLPFIAHRLPRLLTPEQGLRLRAPV